MIKATYIKKDLFRVYSSIEIGTHYRHARSMGAADKDSIRTAADNSHPDPQTGSREHTGDGRRCLKLQSEANDTCSRRPPTPLNPFQTVSPSGDQVFEPMGAMSLKPP